MRIQVWYIAAAALTSVAVEMVLSAKVPITSCPLNHYAVLNDEGNGISSCRVCDSCPPGYGVVQPCSPTKNTVCGLCDMGTFSTTVSATASCKPCQTCQSVGMVKECSPISDTVCMEHCPFGEYFDPTTLSCQRCSYCFPDRLYARTARVVDCQRQGLHIDHQCSPLPGADAVGVVHSRVVTADRHRSAAAARRHRGRTVHTSSADRTAQRAEMSDRRQPTPERAPETQNNNDEAYVDVVPSTIPLFRSTEAPPLFEARPMRPDKVFDPSKIETSAKSGVQFTSTNAYDSKDQASRVYIDTTKHDFDPSSIPKSYKQESIIPYYHSLTSTDVVLLIVIVIIVMLISIVITVLSCYCWMSRGKNLHGQKVKAISSKPPSNAWSYQDMMPSSLTEHLIQDTPPQSRKLMTCV
ncbi:uncharacterized protein LOC575008 [Strongylocentrotus purpuratus]|uniref:TNFR-Cys domain-containing protein n=1 Tax=Strongylocentrotus purpuratus TaxID=7668 RepID=A0A7M7RBU5_STRPU|nr:uncharacterized protein LOC575008 [Strongylocentrotus purpuratus]